MIDINNTVQLAIDDAARSAIRCGDHDRYELYVDDLFFHSLRFKYGFDKHAQPNTPCIAPMSATLGKYYCTTASTILDNLDPTPPASRRKRNEA